MVHYLRDQPRELFVGGICQLNVYFFFFLRRYNFREVLAFSTSVFHLVCSLMQSFHFVIFILVMSLFTSSSHLFFGLPRDLLVWVTTRRYFILCSFLVNPSCVTYILLSKWLWWFLLTVAVPSPMPVLGTGLVLYALCTYIGCFRRNRLYFGRMCVRVIYSGITKPAYIWSCAVTETVTWEKYVCSASHSLCLTLCISLHCPCCPSADSQVKARGLKNIWLDFHQTQLHYFV